MLNFILPSLPTIMMPHHDGEPIDHSEQAGAEIIQGHVADFRSRWDQGQIASPIRDLTIMVGGLQRELTKQGLVEIAGRIKNLTIGDVDANGLAKDGGMDLPLDLGLNPWGETRARMNSYVEQVRREEWGKGGSSLTRYQADALGLLPLREQFDGFLHAFGLKFEPSETIITGGSLPGINMVFESVQAIARKKSRATSLIAPTPGFSVYYSQAERRDIPVTKIPTEGTNGFCTTAESLGVALRSASNAHDIFYVTIPNNPTSTTYDLQSLRDSLSTFHSLRPNGVIVVDLAYIEMIPKEQAAALLSLFEKTDTLSQAIFAVSMSKNFGYPRLRCAALYTKNSDLFKALQATSQTVYASQSSPMELEALAMWKYVTPIARQHLFALFRQRQQALLSSLALTDEKRIQAGKGVLTDPDRTYTDVPLYVCAGLAPGVDTLTLFQETLNCGVPIEVFGGSNGMARFSVGIEPLAAVAHLA